MSNACVEWVHDKHKSLLLVRLLTMGGAAAQIWDVARHKQIRSLRGHSARVGALSWNHSTLSSGSRDSSIINHDVRCAALS